MTKLSLEIKNKIIEDLKNNVCVKEVMNNYNISRATIFRLKKDYNKNQYESNIDNQTEENNDNETEDNNETVNNETVNNETDNNETVNNQTEEDDNEEEDDKETVNNFNIEQFKKELNNTMQSLDNESVKNDVSLISNNNSVKSIKSVVQFKKKPQIIKPENINDKNNILDTIKNCNVATDITELKEIRSTIIIIKQYLNTFEKDLKNIYGNNRYIFEKRLFTLNLNQLKTILEDIRICINLKTNKSSFLTISQMAIKSIEAVSNYSGYDVSGLEQELMNDQDFLLDLQIISCELDLSKYLNPKSSAFLKVVRKMVVLNNQNKMKKTINNINNNEQLLNKIKELNIKK